MAEDNTTRSQGTPSPSDALSSASAEFDEAFASSRQRIAGYIPAEVDPAGDSSDADGAEDLTDAADEGENADGGLPDGNAADDGDAGLRGEELSRDLADPEPFDVVDDEAEELEGSDDDAYDDEYGDTAAWDVTEGDVEVEIDDPEQLADAEAVAVAARSTRPVKRVRKPADADDDALPATTRPVRKTSTASAPARKATKTPSRKETAPVAAARSWTNPAQFVRESIAELRKVVWPTGSQVRQYFVVVLAFVLFIIAFVGLLDFGLGWALLKLLG